MSVKQATQVLDLLDFFAQRQGPATLTDIARHFGWPRSSTFNLLAALTARGMLYEPQARGGYYPAPALATLVQRIEQAQPLPQALQQLLRTLADETGETVVLAAPAGGQVLFIAALESAQAVRYSAAPGKRIPLHATATGRALLAQMTAGERASLLRKAPFQRHTPSTLMSADEVEQEIRRSLERGWFEGRGEYSADLGGVALALALPQRQLALLVAGPVSRVGGRLDALAQLMQQQVARHLGPAQAPG
ncbi:MAG: IclR family transcriptional regulator [Burkholderiaceae bacterium]|nr:IclR family transcriptional regulator [Burkholderiaceae bacterium]